MIMFFLPKSKLSAKLMMMATGVLFIIALLIFAFLFGKTYIKQKTWITVSATVVDYDTFDISNAWTEFTYQMNDTTHTVKLPEHPYWMYEGTEVELLCSPDDSQKIEIKSDVINYPKAIIALPLIFGGFWLLYLLFFFYWCLKEHIKQHKKQHEAR